MTIRKISMILVFGVVASALVLPLGSSPVSADVIHLRTGESVKGRPVAGRCDEKVLVIEDFLNGSLRTFAWEVVDPEDRDRLQEDLGLKNKALQAVVGHRIVIELNQGKETLRGLINREDSEYYYLLQGGKELRVRKAMVLTKDEEPMDPRDIWSPEQLVDRFMKGMESEENVDISNLTARHHYRIGEYAEKAGAFETAKKHYEICAADETFLLAHVAKTRLERVESILKNQAALDDLRAIRQAVSLKAFRKVREMLEKFKEDHPDAGEAIAHRLERGKSEFVKRRNAYFQLEAKINLPKILKKMIKVKVQEKDIGLSDVTGWTKRELVDLAFEDLAALFSKRDDVTPEEARTFWEGRPKSNWRTESYGSGTFIVEPPKIKPPKRKRTKNKRSSSKKGTTTFKPPKPPNQDQWWEMAKTPMRVTWVMAFVAENSGLFEVSANPKYSKCQKCNGEGLESKRFQSGQIVYYLCTRCGGAQRDKRVKFR